MSGRLPMAALLPFPFAVGLFTIQPWSFQVGSIPIQVVLAWLSAALFMVLRARTVLRLTAYIGVVPIHLGPSDGHGHQAGRFILAPAFELAFPAWIIGNCALWQRPSGARV